MGEYRDTVGIQVEQRVGGGANLRIISSGKDKWEGASNVLSLTPDERDWLIAELQGTQ